MNGDQSGDQPPTQPAVRLLFEYDGTDVRLVAEQPVEMAITGFDIARSVESGYYVEVRDAEEATLARLPARGAFAASAEVFPEQHGEPITRIDVEPKGAFTVVVPAPERAHHVSLVAMKSAGEEGGPAGLSAEPERSELGSFRLESWKKGETP